MTRLAPTVALLALVATGCRMTTAPDPAEGIGPPSKVYAPVLEEEIGQLFVQMDGLWAFRTPQPARAKSYQLGQIVVFGALDESRRHLFAVVETADWGVRLQRLDVDAVEGRTEGTLVPLAQLDFQTGLRWGFCAGTGDPTKAECLQQAESGTRWWLYPMTEAGTAKMRAEKKADRGDMPRLPIALAGQVSVGAFGADVVGVAIPQRWLAVPGMVGPRPTRPRIAVETNCHVGSPHREALDAQWVSTDLRPPENLLQVASEAARLGADALVWCVGEATRVAVPSLYRPQIEIIGRDLAVPPMLGTQIIELPRSNSGATDLVARLGAAASTGDFESVNYYAEALADLNGAKRPVDRILVDSMTAIASGGRPELAARMGRWATRLQWNPENDPAWQLGMARVEESLGNRKAAITRTAEVADLLQRAGDEDRQSWMTYFYTIGQVRARGAAQDRLEPLKSRPELALAARAEIARSTDKSMEGLRGEFARAHALALWQALAGESSELRCESDCAADSYGHLWAAGDVGPETLSRVGRIALRPGYGAPADEAGRRLEALAAMYPLAEDEQRADLLAEATVAALAWASSPSCSAASTDPPSPELIALGRIGADAALRTGGDEPSDLTMEWLTTRGVQAACSSTEVLAERAAEIAQTSGAADVPTAFFELHVRRAPADRIVSVLEAATAFATRFERAERCAEWTTALAAAFAQADDFARSRLWIQQAAHCDVENREAIDLMGAYLNFQRTSSTTADFAASVRTRLRDITRAELTGKNLCVGTQRVDYEIMSALPESIRQLAKRLDVPPVGVDDDLSLVTANDRLSNAREHLGGVTKLFDARDFVAAAKSLGFAFDAFSQVGHEVGIAQCNWLDGVLFGKQARAVARGEASFDKVGLASLRKKGTLSEASGVDVELALALISGKTVEAVKLATGKIALKSTLCEPSTARSRRGVALELSGGQLRKVGGDDGGPEIELVVPPPPPPEP